MSTSEQKYILGLNGMAIHFSTAADGSDSVALEPITAASFEASETGLIIFSSEKIAADCKDGLCTIAANLESPSNTGTQFVPHTLETYCDLKIVPLPEFIIA